MMTASNSPLKRSFSPLAYDTILWACTLAIEIFFREISTRSTWKVPKNGPLLIVAGPHANQFVDSVILAHVLKKYAKRRVSFLIAEKSMHEPYIGTMAHYMGALPVARAQDMVKSAPGKIYFPDPDGDSTLIEGIGTDFRTEQFMVGGTIVFPRMEKESPGQATIAEIIGPNQLRIKKAVKLHEGLHDRVYGKEGVSFKLAPYIDQKQVFDAATDHLLRGGCIGIFPEGGSHDRPTLLPLKAGAAIMALNTLAEDPDCGLSIVPCGLNYFHAHKFRSRAVIEFGSTIDVHPDQVTAYKAGGAQKRNAIGSLLETINEGLIEVTQSSPDYETMMLIQATRRLYNPIGKKLPLSAVIELNRRLIAGYKQFQDDPRVISLTKAVIDYNQRLQRLGVKDHQIEWGDAETRPWWLIFGTLMYRTGQILLLGAGTFPGLLLFWPVFVATKVISKKKQEKALAGSVVKLRGRDVVSTWKLLVSAGLAPALYIWYTAVTSCWLVYCRRFSPDLPQYLLATTYVPRFVPLWTFAVGFFALLIAVTFAALRIGEIGMDVIKSLPPLIVALNPLSRNAFTKLRLQRQALSAQVTDTINALGPEIFENFDRDRIVEDPYKAGAYQSHLKTMDESNGSRSQSRHVKSLSGDIDVSFLPLTDQLGIDRRIRDAMQSRGRERTREFEQDEDEDEEDKKKK